MASIKERISKTGVKTYQVQIRRKGYPPISKNCSTMQEARDYAAITEAELLKNENRNPREATKWTIPEVINWYIENPNKNRKLETKKHFNRLYFLREEFKDFTVHSLTPQILNKWINKRLEINEHSTVYHYYVALKNAMMHHATMHGYAQTLFDLTKCPTKSNERDRRFLPDEIRKLFKSIHKTSKNKQKEMMITVLFAVETACRIGEMLQLKWSEVDIKNKKITFLAHTTKTKTFRKVPITSVAQRILIWIQKYHNPEKDKSKRVFEFWHLNEHHLSRQFKICCNRADIKDIRWHDLRHEATSRFFEKGNGLTDMEIAHITGHKTLQMLKRYSHLREDNIGSKLW